MGVASPRRLKPRGGSIPLRGALSTIGCNILNPALRLGSEIKPERLLENQIRFAEQLLLRSTVKKSRRIRERLYLYCFINLKNYRKTLLTNFKYWPVIFDFGIIALVKSDCK
jgi:hypothetical protein